MVIGDDLAGDEDLVGVGQNFSRVNSVQMAVPSASSVLEPSPWLGTSNLRGFWWLLRDLIRNRYCVLKYPRFAEVKRFGNGWRSLIKIKFEIKMVEAVMDAASQKITAAAFAAKYRSKREV